MEYFVPVLLILYAVSTIANLILVTHIAFFQKRYDLWAINTLGQYVEHLFYSFMPVVNTLLLFLYFYQEKPLNVKLKKFVKKQE